jgi:hypothetical protein
LHGILSQDIEEITKEPLWQYGSTFEIGCKLGFELFFASP